MEPPAIQWIDRLRALADPARLAGMARFGIRVDAALGVPLPAIRALAREAKAACRPGGDAAHEALALALWDAGLLEARFLASMLHPPAAMSATRMEQWAAAFNAWDICDQCCNNCFRHAPPAWDKAHAWSARPEEFVKRAGFVLMAVLAVGDKRADDARFLDFFPAMERECRDGRTYVKKAINWALRQIGKRSRALHGPAQACARRIGGVDHPAARWIARDALRELADPKTIGRIRR
ncbi:MAG: DNA alkylation repair protein [Desulfovibrionaceae bacterium]